MFESSCYFSNMWTKVVKKVPYSSPSAFDHFADHLWWMYLIVCCCEVYSYSFEVFFCFFLDVVGSFSYGGGLVIK